MYNKDRHPPQDYYMFNVVEREESPHLQIVNTAYKGYFYTMLGITTYLNKTYATEISDWKAQNDA